MGCGGSKLNPNANPLPVKIRPLLIRRFNELRRKSRNTVSSDPLANGLSKKELLKDVIVPEDDNSAHSNHDHLFDNRTPSSPRSPRVAPEPENEPEKLSKQRMMPEKDIKPGDTGDFDRFRDDGIGPGSPSFRFYFIESLTDEKGENHELDGDHSDKEEDDSDKHVQTEKSSSVDVDSINSDSAAKIEKKTRKIHRLRKVIPRARTGAVKNLLNVRSCYNPSRGGSHDNARLLQKTSNSI